MVSFWIWAFRLSSSIPRRGVFLSRRRPAGHAHEPVGRNRRDFVNSGRPQPAGIGDRAAGRRKDARRIASAIIAARPITGTAQLARIVSEAQGPAALRHAIHLPPAPSRPLASM